MNGTSFLIDTNIALYLLGGNKTIAQIVDGSQIFVSFITELELLGYKNINLKEQQSVKRFLNDCIIIELNEEIKKLTIDMRQKYQIKLPDSIIAASAIFADIPLLTADKGFKKITKLNLALFEQI